MFHLLLALPVLAFGAAYFVAGMVCIFLALVLVTVFAVRRRFRQVGIVLGTALVCGAAHCAALAATAGPLTAGQAGFAFLFGAGGPGVVAGVVCLVVEIAQRLAQRMRASTP